MDEAPRAPLIACYTSPTMLDTRGWAAFDATSPLRPWSFTRAEPGPRDVLIDIAFCGICHSDVHQVRNEWQNGTYPMVPGHEIVWRVSAVGSEVTRVAPGDLAGVGCLVGSCRTCASCREGLEQFCDGQVFTYNSALPDGSRTQGGYSTRIAVDEHFTLKLPAGVPLERVAPLLCAGITTWSPLRHWGLERGQRLGVVGLGGLGHMAVKLGAALGAEVTVLSHSARKREDAKRLGAHDFVISTEHAAMAKCAGRFDLIIDTVSAPHDMDALLATVRRDGALVLVGVPERPLELSPFGLVMRRKTVAGSLIGGIAETQEMLDFCGTHSVAADVEVIAVDAVNEAFDRLVRGDVRYRFVIDTSTIR